MQRVAAGRRVVRGGIRKVARAVLPRGLLGRSLLIILVPMVILQAVALQLFYGGHLDVISRRLAGGVAGDVGLVVQLLEREGPTGSEWIFREASWRLDMLLAYEPGARLKPVEPPRGVVATVLPMVADLNHALTERLPGLAFDTDWQSDPRSVIIRVQLPGGVLHVETPRKRLFTATLYLFVIWLVGSALLLFAVAAIFMKNQVRAMRRLAVAVEDFGRGRDVGPIKPEGATEVRAAANAFNRMQARISRYMQQRTDMLAGISHDLRTPLTRMRLGLAMLPQQPETEQDVEALTEDVAEMERMIASYLAFARGEGAEQAVPSNLAELVRDEAAKARRAGAVVSVAGPAEISLPLRVDGMRRCLGNLLGNARRHASRIAVGVASIPRANGTGRWAEVTVDDDGPGIPPAAREEAFRPFASFTPQGTGLGLAITRDIVRAHGGEIMLEESPLGGLRARFRLPY